MTSPNSQHYKANGRYLGIDDAVLDSAVATIDRLHKTSPNLVPVFTLRHLSVLTGVPYGYLRRVIGRQLGGYRHALLRKQVPGRTRHRLISIPSPQLAAVQQWIVRNILRHTSASSASYAYHPGSRPTFAALEHREAEWLLKVDVEDFFHNITERQVSAAFHRLGYPRLLSFELGRLTTFVPTDPKPSPEATATRWPTIRRYQVPFEGVLPQGAPTSPMLSNLVMLDLDLRLSALAREHEMRYTRYADDLAFSCRKGKSREHVENFKKLVLKELSKEGFQHNRRKTVIRGPGTRRVVLGILVDGSRPRLSQDFKDLLRLHLYFLRSPGGPSQHAERRKVSVSSVFHHVRGLIGWAMMVDPIYGERLLAEFKTVEWPPIQPKEVEHLYDWSEEE